MKWYSVKKYRPTNENKLILYDECGCITVGYYTCVSSMGEEKEYHFVNEEFKDIWCNITHFCIPDPVEIEEWKKGALKIHMKQNIQTISSVIYAESNFTEKGQ